MQHDGLKPKPGSMPGHARQRVRAGLRLALLCGVTLGALPATAQVIAIDPPRPSDRPEDLRLIAPDASRHAVSRTVRPRTRPDNPLELQLPSIDAMQAVADGTQPLTLPDPWSVVGSDDAPRQPAASEDTPAPGAPARTAEPRPDGALPEMADVPGMPGDPGLTPGLIGPPPPSIPPPAFALDRFTPDSFLADRARLLAAYVAAHDGGDTAASDAAAMDLATFYLSWHLLPETRSIVTALDPAAMSPENAARHGALDLASNVLAGQGVSLDAAPLVALGPGVWADRALWAALAGHLAGNETMVAASLPGALDILDHAPPEFVGPVLLPLLEAAIGARQWNVMGAIAERIAQVPGLQDSSDYNYLLGTASAASGQPEAAFDAYARAAAGTGAAAQRARLALADLGIAAGGASLRKTADMLTSARYDWRGGPLELDLLDRLARTEDRIGNAPAALRWYGQTLSLFAGTPEAAHAEERTRVLLTRVYDDGASGKIDIGTFLTLHRNIAPDLRRLAGFDLAAEKLGRRLLELGATAVAAEEFAAIRKGLEDGRDAGLWPVAEERLTEVRLDEAEALLAGGQVPPALALLTPAAPGTLAPAIEQKLATLRVEALWASGALDELRREPLSSDPGTTELRRIAEAQFTNSDWMRAKEMYRALWHDHPRDFGFADAARLLLSAYHSGDTATATAVAAAFPDLTAEADWQRVAQALLTEPAPVTPLRDAAIAARMTGSADTVTRLRDLQTALEAPPPTPGTAASQTPPTTP